MEVLNESLMGFMFYHLVLFSLFTTNEDSKFAFGDSFVGLIGALMAFNIGFAVYSSVSDYRRRKKLELMKKVYDERVAHLWLTLPKFTKE